MEDYQNKEWLEDILASKTIDEIAEEFDLHIGDIHDMIKRFELYEWLPDV